MIRKTILSLTLLLLLGLPLKAQINTSRLTTIGQNALYFEDYVLAIQYFNQVIRSKPMLDEPYFYRAVAKIQLEDYEGAQKDLDLVISRNPFIPMAFYARSFTYKADNQWALAIKDLSKALEFSPENATYLLHRVEAYEHLNELDSAMTDLKFLVKRNPHAINLLCEKGRIEFQQKDTTSALETFTGVIKIDSLNPEVWASRGMLYLATNKDSAALYDYNKAVALGTDFAPNFTNRGVVFYRLKNFKMALSDYDKALSLDPSNDDARFNRAILRTQLGDYDRAQEDLETILTHNPKAYEVMLQLASIKSKVGQNAAALDLFSKILLRYPYFISGYYARSDVYQKLGDEKKAYLDLEKASDLSKHRDLAQDSTHEENTQLAKKEKIAQNNRSNISNLTRIFNPSSEDETTGDNIRGNIQNDVVRVTNEPNFQLSFYKQKSSSFPTLAHNSDLLSAFKRAYNLGWKLYIVNKEVSLSTSMINYHFQSISTLTSAIEKDPTNAQYYTKRAFDFALVQDLGSAIDDLSKAILYSKEETALLYFSRANIRLKQLQSNMSTLNVSLSDRKTSQNSKNAQLKQMTTLDLNEFSAAKKRYSVEFELIMRDYDQCIEKAPDFAYAWYNRGNMLGLQKDYTTAINNYSSAIQINDQFGEAYFNRGLTYIYLGEAEKGKADLSKAGELGIYKAYSILKKINLTLKQE